MSNRIKLKIKLIGILLIVILCVIYVRGAYMEMIRKVDLKLIEIGWDPRLYNIKIVGINNNIIRLHISWIPTRKGAYVFGGIEMKYDRINKSIVNIQMLH